MTRMATVRMALGAVAPVAAAVLTVAGVVPPDLAISFIAVLLSIALLPGIAQNFREKTGWNKESTIYTTTSLFSLTVIYFVLSLTVSTATVLAESVLWAILAFQAFLYGGTAVVHIRRHPRKFEHEY